MGKVIKLDSEHELVILDDGGIKIFRDNGDVVALSAAGAEALACAISVEPWIPVEKQLPDDGIEVQVYNQLGDEYYIAFRGEDQWWAYDFDVALDSEKISHWRDLVAPVREV